MLCFKKETVVTIHGVQKSLELLPVVTNRPRSDLGDKLQTLSNRREWLLDVMKHLTDEGVFALDQVVSTALYSPSAVQKEIDETALQMVELRRGLKALKETPSFQVYYS
jgi:hypothetical protein